MPEAPIYEQNRFVFGKDDVGGARQRLVERVPEALSMEKLADI
jgi:hypothetical protein